MKHKKLYFLPLLLFAILVTAACSQVTNGGDGDVEPTDIPIVVDDFDVVAEGRLVPKDSVQLAFTAGGQVAEVLVAEGDTVQAGDVLAQLGDREPLESAIAGAELELLAAELEASAAELELQSARLDVLTAQQALDTLYENWPEQATAAQQALKDARQSVYDTDRRLNILTNTASQPDIDAAQAQVVLAGDRLDKAKEDFEPYQNKPETNITRAVFQSRLAEAQSAYDATVRRFNALAGTANDFDISQAETEMVIADARLAQAEEDYLLLKDGPDPDDLALAETRIAAAEARVQTAEARITTAQGRKNAAQASITAAQAALDNLDLVATIDGTIVELDLIVGEQVNPGAVVVLIADFSEWYVETDNLTEIEVVDVSEGQPVLVTPDALPDLDLSGTVDSIGDVFEEKRGDVTYTARILLEDIDPQLRWGMTVVVTFEQ